MNLTIKAPSPADPQPINFPVLMQYIGPGEPLVVLFTSPTAGIAFNSAGRRHDGKAFVYADSGFVPCGNRGIWVPFEGTVELRN